MTPYERHRTWQAGKQSMNNLTYLCSLASSKRHRHTGRKKLSPLTAFVNSLILFPLKLHLPSGVSFPSGTTARRLHGLEEGSKVTWYLPRYAFASGKKQNVREELKRTGSHACYYTEAESTSDCTQWRHIESVSVHVSEMEI